MNGMSSLRAPNVSTCVTPIHYIEPKPVPKPSMIEVPDDDAHLQRTLYPSPNGELCFHIDCEPEPEIPLPPPHRARTPTTPKPLVEDMILDRCQSLYPDLLAVTDVLSRWVHHGCEGEVDKQLISALLFLDRDLA